MMINKVYGRAVRIICDEDTFPDTKENNYLFNFLLVNSIGANYVIVM